MNTKRTISVFFQLVLKSVLIPIHCFTSFLIPNSAAPVQARRWRRIPRINAAEEDRRIRGRWRRIPRNSAAPDEVGLIQALLPDFGRLNNASAAPDEDGLPRRRRGRWRRIARPNYAAPEEETAVNGLSEEVVSRFMQTTDHKAEGDPEVCAVCLENYGENQRAGVLRCRHRFHADCIGKWLQIKSVCPLCNAVSLSINQFVRARQGRFI